MIQAGFIAIIFGMLVMLLGAAGIEINRYIDRKLEPLKPSGMPFSNGYVSWESDYGEIAMKNLNDANDVMAILKANPKKKETPNVP